MPTHVLTGMFAQELDLLVGWGSRKLGDTVLALGGKMQSGSLREL